MNKSFTNACNQVRQALQAIDSNDYVVYAPQVLDVFRRVPRTLAGDVFYKLDSSYESSRWHSMLRNVRNDPHRGSELFEIWSH